MNKSEAGPVSSENEKVAENSLVYLLPNCSFEFYCNAMLQNGPDGTMGLGDHCAGPLSRRITQSR
jgi:hypothetical protein